jgi:hypothetical protein
MIAFGLSREESFELMETVKGSTPYLNEAVVKNVIHGLLEQISNKGFFLL